MEVISQQMLQPGSLNVHHLIEVSGLLAAPFYRPGVRDGRFQTFAPACNGKAANCRRRVAHAGVLSTQRLEHWPRQCTNNCSRLSRMV